MPWPVVLELGRATNPGDLPLMAALEASRPKEQSQRPSCCFDGSRAVELMPKTLASLWAAVLVALWLEVLEG